MAIAFDRTAITGGRWFRDILRIGKDLYVLQVPHIAQGCAKGADLLAKTVALKLKIQNTDFAVDHNVDGSWPGAGPNRNERMIRTFDPTFLLGYPDPTSKGTWHCISMAMHHGIYTAVWLPWANPRDLKHTYRIVSEGLQKYGIKDPLIVNRGGFRVIVAPLGVDKYEAAQEGLPLLDRLCLAGDDP